MSELDKTIEELEAEVLAELEEIEEANGADAPKKGAAPAEKSDLKDESDDIKPEDASKKAKEVSGDAQQKGEGKPDKPEKLAAGDYVEPEEGQEVVVEARMTKDMMKKEMMGKMENMKAVELKAAYEGMMQPSEEMDEESQAELKKLEDAKAEIEEKIKTISVKEDVDALTEGEEFSEEFKKKAATVFEAAVKSKMRSEVERICEAVNSEKEVEVETFKDELTEKVDTYLNYVVETWTKENELAIERGLKGEIAEDFISGLKQLFEDHYIDVPDEKYDVLEAQSEKIAELEEKINEEIQKNVDISQQNSGLVREQVIAQVSEDLADTEIEKFKSLTEDVDFADEESFREKLSTLKESYFPKVAPSSNAGTSFDDEDGGTAQDVDTTDTMHKYMSAISRDHKASA